MACPLTRTKVHPLKFAGVLRRRRMSGIQFHKSPQQFGGGVSHAFSARENVGMTERPLTSAGSVIRDAGKRGDSQPALSRHNYFGDGAHSDGIGAEPRKGANLRGRLVAWAADGGIDAPAQRD